MSHSITELIKYMDRQNRKSHSQEWDYEILPKTLKEIAKKWFENL